MIRRAVILAAGYGSRMGGGPPKPLVRVRGVPLAMRAIWQLEQAGIRDIAIVVGHRSREVRDGLVRAARHRATRLRFIDNPKFHEPNGVSLRAAGDLVEERTLLLMADHLFAPAMLEPLVSLPADGRTTVLAIDRNFRLIFDLDDATKVRTRGDRLVDIGKTLSPYDAVDTGLFVVSPALIQALCAHGAPQLSDGVRTLAHAGLVRVLALAAARWVDVDTPIAREYAEWMLGRYGEQLDGGVPVPVDPAIPPAA